MADKYTRNLEYIAENMGQDLLPFISTLFLSNEAGVLLAFRSV